VLGVVVLFLAATTTSTLSLIDQVPLSVHIVFDYVITAVLIASPFLFSFSSESTPTAVFIAGGVVWLLLSIGTRYRAPADDAPAERPSRLRPSKDAVPDEQIPEFEPPPSRGE
jgi:hypothetical protein